MEYVVIRPPIKSVTHPETILAHYVVTRTRIREVINAYYAVSYTHLRAHET